MRCIAIRKVVDLTGKKFGKLVATKRSKDYISPSGHRQTMWECICECGKTKSVNVGSLMQGKTKSCGCIQKDRTLIANKKYNTYNLTKDYGIGYTQKGEEFYFDLEDYDKIKDYCWRMDSNGYIVTSINNTQLLIHRLIMNVVNDDYLEIDHIYHKLFDNRKSQLRVVFHEQNMMNSIMYKNNTSGTTGIRWNQNANKWEAFIGVNGKYKYLGLFNDKDEAELARQRAEVAYFGEYGFQAGNTIF